MPLRLPLCLPPDTVPRVHRCLLTLCLLSSCTEEPEQTTDSPPSAPAGDPQLVALQPRPAPQLELVDPGTEPRHRLARAPTPGTTEPITVTLDSTTHLRADGQALPEIVSPTLSLKGRIEIDDVRDDAIVVRHLVDEVAIADDSTAPALLVQQLVAAKPAFASYRATLTLDPRGGLREGSVEVPAEAGAAATQLLHQLTDSLVQSQVPLPQAAVGTGAKWTAVSRVEQGQMAVRQQVDYELTKIEGTRLLLTATVKQSLLDTHVAVPGMPGTKAKVELFRSTGHGTIELDTAHVVPTDCRLQLTVKMVMEAGGGQQEIDLTLQASVRRASE